MCNFFGVSNLAKKKITLNKVEVDIAEAQEQQWLKPVHNGFEYENALILIQDDDNKIIPVNAHWEFIPDGINNMKQVVEARKNGIPWLNATSEKLLESNMFKEAATHRRCLILATHFYEWQQINDPFLNKNVKIPYAISVANQPYFFMAGIYNVFKDVQTNESNVNFALVTTAANSFMAALHNTKKRMPTILNEALSYQWLQKSLKENYINTIAKHQIDSEKLEAFTISSNFKKATNPLQKVDYSNILKPNTLF